MDDTTRAVEDTTEDVEDTTEDVEDTTEEVEDTTGKVENSDENEDYFEVVFEEKISKLILKISDPIEEGNLIINEVKAQTETSLDKKK